MDRLRFGRSIRALRVRRGWRQQDLADRAGLSRSAVSRIELGSIRGTPWADLLSITEVLDARLGLDLQWRGGDLDRLLDAAHAAVLEALVTLFRNAGWELVVEATFSEFGERGSIDLLAWHRPTGHVAVCEVKATIVEAGRTVMGVDRKARLAATIARKLGWNCTVVSRLLVVAGDATSRRRIARHAGMFRTAFPLGGAEVRSWLTRPSNQPIGGLLFLASTHPVGVRKALSRTSRIRPRPLRTAVGPSGGPMAPDSHPMGN